MFAFWWFSVHLEVIMGITGYFSDFCCCCFIWCIKNYLVQVYLCMKKFFLLWGPCSLSIGRKNSLQFAWCISILFIRVFCLVCMHLYNVLLKNSGSYQEEWLLFTQAQNMYFFDVADSCIVYHMPSSRRMCL